MNELPSNCAETSEATGDLTNSFDSILEALGAKGRVSGLSHNFYRYPARMSPDLAHAVIEKFSAPDDTVLDPFMGGGTSIIEALVAGRKAIGIDLNPISTFVTDVKTSPLSANQIDAIVDWSKSTEIWASRLDRNEVLTVDHRLTNLPDKLLPFLVSAQQSVTTLPGRRTPRFARCVLLRVAQLLTESWTNDYDFDTFSKKLVRVARQMCDGIEDFSYQVKQRGLKKNQITGRRLLLEASTIGVENSFSFDNQHARPKLVLTSPPYPGVHVLYHRWQINGRRETPVPYWIVDSPDGHGPAHFTMGGRSARGVESYFHMIAAAYKSVRMMIHDDGVLVQLVAFTDIDRQLPSYLEAMSRAGFKSSDLEISPNTWRTVPNRRWFAHSSHQSDSSNEVLLVHRPQ